MNTKKITIAVAVLLVLIIGWYALESKKNDSQVEDGALQPVDTEVAPVESTPASISQAEEPTSVAPIREIIVAGSNFKFEPTLITVKQGEKVRLVFSNTGGNHDFKIDELGVATKIIKGGETDTVEFTADKKGTFEFYCSVGSHRAMGMKGAITVQ